MLNVLFASYTYSFFIARVFEKVLDQSYKIWAENIFILFSALSGKKGSIQRSRGVYFILLMAPSQEDVIYALLLLVYATLLAGVGRLLYQRSQRLRRKKSIQHSDTKSILEIDSLRRQRLSSQGGEGEQKMEKKELWRNIVLHMTWLISEIRWNSFIWLEISLKMS